MKLSSLTRTGRALKQQGSSINDLLSRAIRPQNKQHLPEQGPLTLSLAGKGGIPLQLHIERDDYSQDEPAFGYLDDGAHRSLENGSRLGRELAAAGVSLDGLAQALEKAGFAPALNQVEANIALGRLFEPELMEVVNEVAGYHSVSMHNDFGTAVDFKVTATGDNAPSFYVDGASVTRAQLAKLLAEAGITSHQLAVGLRELKVDLGIGPPPPGYEQADRFGA